MACGFCDQSHLTRAFREALEVTPAHYRRVHAAVV
ncbi:MAG TPA: AraC family transcriptional regulator [Thermoanaerobaculia bacterium]|nr:AraC family transcriptional regulator [Thermoanaerobaculia bacterium]